MAKDPLDALEASAKAVDPLDALEAQAQTRPSDLDARKDEIKARLTQNENTASNLDLGSAVGSALVGAGETLPGMKALGEHLAPGDTQANAQSVQRAEDAHPIAHGAGMAAGAVGEGVLAAPLAAGSKAVGAAQIAGKAAGYAAQGAAIATAYKAGEILHQDNMEARPLTVEQIGHMFDLETMGLGAALGVAFPAAGKLVSKGLDLAAEHATTKLIDKEALSLGKARKIARTGASKEELAAVMRNKDVFSSAGASARLKETSDTIGNLVSRLEQGPELTQGLQAANQVLQSAQQTLRVPAQRAGLETLEKNLAILNEIDPATKSLKSSPADFYAVAKALRGEASRMEYDAAKPLWEARQTILDSLENTNAAQFPNEAGRFSGALHDYRILVNLEGALPNASKQATAGDVITAGAGILAGEGVGRAIGGPVGASIGGVLGSAAGAKTLWGKSYAKVLSNLEAGPMGTFFDKTGKTIEKLLKPGAYSGNKQLDEIKKGGSDE